MKKINWISLLFYILFPMILAFIVKMLLPDMSTFLDTIITPFDIPSIIFPIVWTILYLLLGISTYLISLKEKTKEVNEALILYFLNVFVNITWPVFFFGFKLLLFSVIWIMVLLILTIYLIVKYYKLNKISAYLLIPYILWLIFATYLSISIYYLNL